MSTQNVECPECSGTGKHRVIAGARCVCCDGAKEISPALQDELFRIAIAERDARRKLQAAAAESRIVTAECLGHPTDFRISQRCDRDSVTITVETALPGIRWDGDVLHTFPPPRFPWPRSNDRA